MLRIRHPFIVADVPRIRSRAGYYTPRAVACWRLRDSVGANTQSCPRSSADRALASGASGRRFKSCRGRQCDPAVWGQRLPGLRTCKSRVSGAGANGVDDHGESTFGIDGFQHRHVCRGAIDQLAIVNDGHPARLASMELNRNMFL